ncbi:ganglioside GM2 activator-like [Panonychus citri]|uniref:ganglioside GM2 activator-like n=1 Tax=Panonychus citri TaxID=50023 RepID=UPI00230821BF|nr:ganglioside GM2 activator-like [Panonychus citri]
MFIKLIVLCLLPVSILCTVRWEDCGQADRSLVFHKLNFASDRIVIDGKQPLKAEVSFDLLDSLDYDVQMDATLRRYFTFFGIKRSVQLPCVNDAGSCSGKFCYFVQSYANLARSFAEQLHVPFDCRMQPTTYAGNISYAVPPTAFKRIPSVITEALSGVYELVIRWKSDGHELGCLAISSELAINF